MGKDSRMPCVPNWVLDWAQWWCSMKQDNRGERQNTWRAMLAPVCLKYSQDLVRGLTWGPNFENINRKHPYPNITIWKKEKKREKQTSNLPRKSWVWQNNVSYKTSSKTLQPPKRGAHSVEIQPLQFSCRGFNTPSLLQNVWVFWLFCFIWLVFGSTGLSLIKYSWSVFPFK